LHIRREKMSANAEKLQQAERLIEEVFCHILGE